jgi:hypothetical protein
MREPRELPAYHAHLHALRGSDDLCVAESGWMVRLRRVRAVRVGMRDVSLKMSRTASGWRNRQRGVRDVYIRIARSGPSSSRYSRLLSLVRVQIGASKWRWGESNPRPRATDQGFSGRSRWRISPRGSHRRSASRPAQVRCPTAAPGRSRCRKPAHDARSRVAGDPGRTAT